jgi:hypothetical protein
MGCLATMQVSDGKKSGQFDSKDEWNNYLEQFAQCLERPLQVTITRQNKQL